MLAMSTMLDHLENTLVRAGRTALVTDMSVLRDQGFNPYDLVLLVLQWVDTPSLTGVEHLRFLTQGSPKLRFILQELHQYILPREASGQGNKLLIMEDIPLSAHYMELVLNLTYVETALLHSDLSDEE